MLSFDDIEDCFPDGACNDENGNIIVSAQWLHDFANNISIKVIDLCIEEVRCVGGGFSVECEELILKRFGCDGR